MRSSKKEIVITILFTMAFLLGGILRGTIGQLDFTVGVSRIYYCALVLAWIVTIRYRIIDKRVRRLLIVMATFLIMSFLLQIFRFNLFKESELVGRYIWYAYYIPFSMVPCLFVYVALFLNKQKDEKPHRAWLLLLVPAVFFIVFVMTNDLHLQFFIFEDLWTGRNNTYDHGIWYYIFYGWLVLEIFAALYITILKCRIPSVRKKLWMPLYFASYGLLTICSLFDFPKIGGVTIWLLMEYFAMMSIGIVESCILLGLIPANSSYQTIFRLSDKPIVVRDSEGNTVYYSDVAKEMFQRKETVQLHNKQIQGGSVSWAVDLSKILELNKEIEKVTESIESRNEYLRTENSVKEEQSKLAARNMLYNNISNIISPQLEGIQELIQGNEEDIDNNLAKIVVLNTYIKRRSNLELLKADRPVFLAEELAAAIRESCEYLKLCGVNAMLNAAPDCELAADLQIRAYETFEIILEKCLDSLRFVLVNLSIRDSGLIMRIALNISENMAKEVCRMLTERNEDLQISSETEDNETTITICIEGGGADV